MTNISAVIVNYNSASALQTCVAAINGDVKKLVVVDNHSSDGSLDQFTESQYHQAVHLIENRSNIGFGAAVNQAVGVLDANDDILIVNPDCVLKHEAILRLAKSFVGKEQLGLVAPVVVTSDQTEQSGSRRQLPEPWRLLAYAIGNRQSIDLRYQPLPQQLSTYPAVSGACMLIRRSAWDAVDGMDERFFLHFEDLDIMRRIQIAGFDVGLQPQAIAMHTGGVSSKTAPYSVLWHKHRSLQKYLYKHHRNNPLTWTVLPMMNAVHWLSGVLLMLLKR